MYGLCDHNLHPSILRGEVHAIFAELLQNKRKAHPKQIIFPEI